VHSRSWNFQRKAAIAVGNDATPKRQPETPILHNPDKALKPSLYRMAEARTAVNGCCAGYSDHVGHLGKSKTILTNRGRRLN
jgi:hypothetical protein